MANMRALVVAGGGSGASSGGGGGAGGFRDVPSTPVVAGDYAITVGNGGSSSSGGNSSFGDLIVSIGGGKGGSYPGGNDGESGHSGGSGGGGEGCGSGYSPGDGGLPTSGQGYAGGNGDEDSSTTDGGGGGGGGGAGGAGQNAPNENDGAGGNGASSDITGSAFTCAAGGGGCSDAGPAGCASAGSSTISYGNGGTGGNGNAGVVIIRYATADYPKCTGGTITTVGADTIHTFTASGTFSVGGVSTQSVTDIDFETATGNGTTAPAIGVTVSERGVCYNTSTNPTITNSKSIVAGTSGAFTAPITGLDPNTLYYVRAYMTDSLGNTNYGEVVSFTTSSVEPDSLYKDIDGVDGATYAVYIYVGGTTGSVTVKLGSTGYSEVVAAGAGAVEIEGEYEGLQGLIIQMSGDFDGYIDDVFWVVVLSEDAIDWDLDELVNIIPIDSSVYFRRLEGDNFNRFRVVRYLDVQFKDLDAYVTVLIKKEANETVTDTSKQFIVDNATGETIPFLNKRISMLNKNQAMIVGFSNNRLDETFTVCQFIVKGFDGSDRLFDGGKIINVV